MLKLKIKKLNTENFKQIKNSNKKRVWKKIGKIPENYNGKF